MLAILLVFLGPLVARAALYAAGNDPRSWRDADWSSSGLLPKATADKEARVVVFTGTTGAWKGIFSVHSWIVFKPAGARTWTKRRSNSRPGSSVCSKRSPRAWTA